MEFVKVFGWVLLVAGIGTMLSPLVSGITGFATANLGIGVVRPQITFSLTTFVIGGLFAFVGLLIVNPTRKPTAENV